MNLHDKTIAVIGLGYVGLPLAMEFARTRPVVGFDIRRQRIDELLAGRDSTLEVAAGDLKSAGQIVFTDDPDILRQCEIFIVTVPTPVDKANRPDLEPLIRATETVGKALRSGGVVIYESTVYPGCTREICVPILEKLSGLRLNEGFYVGYSPERANPGDRDHRLTTITKVTSGSTPEAADAIDALYGSVVRAGTHKASSIEVAYVADQVARLMMRRGFPVVGSRILVMGLAFKENCPDIRNSKAIDIVRELRQFNASVEVWDPWISAETAANEAGLDCLAAPPAQGAYDAVVVAVGHGEFIEAGAAGVRALGKSGAVLYDVKGIFGKKEADGRL